jgi:hypothetical protein
MNAATFKQIVERLEIDVPVLRAEELPGGGVRFYLYGGRIVDYSAHGETPAPNEGVIVEYTYRSPRGKKSRKPASKGGAAPGGAETSPGGRAPTPGRDI